MNMNYISIAKALYGENKEFISAWLKGSDPFKKAIGQTILTAAGVA